MYDYERGNLLGQSKWERERERERDLKNFFMLLQNLQTFEIHKTI